MARRMEPKTSEEIALDIKLDIARTIVRLGKRVETRMELNELEAEIKRTHTEEVNGGTVRVPEVPSSADLSSWLAGRAAIPESTDAGDDSKGDDPPAS